MNNLLNKNSNREEETINQNNQLINNIIYKWFWLYFFTYLSAPLRYVTRVIIANSPEVSVTEFWVLYSIISLISLLYTYNDLWLTESLLYFLPKFHVHKQFNNMKSIIYISLFSQIITWIIISIGLWFWSDWLALHYFKEGSASTILKYFCFYFIGTNILQVIQTIFRAFQKTFEYQVIEFIKAFSTMTFSCILLFTDFWNIEWYSLCRLWWIIVTIIFAIILYKNFQKTIIKWIFKRDKSTFKKYIKYALWALIWNWIWSLFWQIILQMVVGILWPEPAWYYSNFLSLFFIGTTLIWPIIFLIFPLTSEHIEQSWKEWISQLLSLFYSYFSVIIFSLSVLFITLGPEIAFSLFGSKYHLSWILLSYTWIFLIFNLMASFNYNILSGIGKVKERVFITFSSLIITIIVAYLWIKNLWIYWASIAFWISNICTRLFSFLLLKKEWYHFSLNRNFIIRNCIVFIILWIIIIFTKKHIIQLNSNRLISTIYLFLVWIIFYWIIWLININKTVKIINIIKKSLTSKIS